ncbi:MAG: AI-2E family transporter [Betaproteobacteria bacterium]
MLSDTQRYAVYFAALFLFAALAWLLRPVLSPFVAAAIFSYMCVPVVDRLTRHRLPRTIAVVAVMLLVLLSLIGLVLVLIPLVEQQVSAVAERLPAFYDWITTAALPWIARTLGIRIDLDLAGLRNTLGPLLKNSSGVAREIIPSLTSGGLAVVSFLGALALFPVVLFYFLRDWHRMLLALEDLLPRAVHGETLSIAREVDQVLGQFLRGQLSVMLSLAVYYCGALWLVGLDSALSIGLLTGIIAFVPYLGFSLGVVLASAAGLIQFHSVVSLLPIWGIFLLGQLLESYVLTPWLVGDRVGLHPVWVIFAILAFGYLLGFVGVLLAVPLASILLVLVRHMKRKYQTSALYD